MTFCGLQDGEKKHNKSNSMADAVRGEENLQEQLGNNFHFTQEWAFTTLGRSRLESLLAHVAPERLLAIV